MPRRSLDLDDLDLGPGGPSEYLAGLGFQKREEETTDTVRWVWFEKTIVQAHCTQLRVELQVEYQLHLTDYEHVPSWMNENYGFNGVYLVMHDRRMLPYDGTSLDEDSASPRLIDRYRTRVATMKELLELERLLRLVEA